MDVAKVRESLNMWSKAVRKTVSHLTLKNVQRWGMVLIIPLVATVIVVRQHILHRTQDLSIWKGGGMGMFASDIYVNRFLKIYIVTPEGDRNPVVRFTRTQNKLLDILQYNPTENNFQRLAENVIRTWWVSSRVNFPYRVIDKSGDVVSMRRIKRLYMRAGSSRKLDYTLDWKLVIEFWKGRYDPETRLVRVKLAKTFTYPQE